MEMRDITEDEEIMACDEWAEQALEYIHEEKTFLNDHGFDVGNDVGKLRTLLYCYTSNNSSGIVIQYK
jgi:hypothetical protein